MKRAFARSKTSARSRFSVEDEIEAIERAVGIPKARLSVATRKETILPTLQLVGNERGDEIQRRETLGPSLMQPCFEDGGQAGEPELTEGGIDDDIHEGSPLLRSMRSP
jgi:hypothetical protein